MPQQNNVIESLASRGRNGDTRLAHLTPGEVVIPKEVAALRPDLVNSLAQQIKAMGGKPERTMVGRGHINHKTGIEEFATEAEVRAAYKATLGRDVEDAGALGYWMNQGDNFGSMFQQAAQKEIAAKAPAPAPAPAPYVDPSVAAYEQKSQEMASWGNNRLSTPEYKSWAAAEPDMGQYNSVQDFGKALESWQVKNPNYINPKNYSTFDAYYQATRDALPSWSGGLSDPHMFDSAVTSYYGAAAAVNPFVGSKPGPLEDADPATAQYILNTQAAAAARGQPYWSLGADGDWVQNAGTGTPGGIGTGGAPGGGIGGVGGVGGVGGTGSIGGGASGGFTAGANGSPSTGINLNQLQGTTPWTVQPNQTVQAQLQQIIASDSPLMQQARTRALQTANGRGLLNSTMSQTAADSAMYDAAFPIAAADAGLYGEAARFNTDASNTFSRDSNAFTRDAFMADFNLAANEWAKQQDQVRTLSTMDYESRLTLDRDAIQNGYQSARDAIQNGYAINADTRKFNWQSKENALTRDTEGKVTQSQQVELDTAKQNAARKAIVDARQSLTNILLNTEKEPNLSSEAKDTMIDQAVDGYQTIVQAHIAESGWTSDAWNYTAA